MKLALNCLQIRARDDDALNWVRLRYPREDLNRGFVTEVPPLVTVQNHLDERNSRDPLVWRYAHVFENKSKRIARCAHRAFHCPIRPLRIGLMHVLFGARGFHDLSHRGIDEM